MNANRKHLVFLALAILAGCAGFVRYTDGQRQITWQVQPVTQPAD